MAEAATAEEGVEVYKKRPPDLVIVDLMMEEVDSGTAFAKELRLLGNQVPIYMLSSVGDSMGCRPTTRRSAWPGSSRSRSVATPCSPS